VHDRAFAARRIACTHVSTPLFSTVADENSNRRSSMTQALPSEIESFFIFDRQDQSNVDFAVKLTLDHAR
jgi:hypothetical protein